MKIRIISIVTAFSLVFGVCPTGYAFSETTRNNDRITINYFCPTYYMPSSDDAIIAYLEDKFDVNIDISGVAWDDYEDKLNMRLSSNEVPDVFSVLNEKKSSLMMKIIASNKAINLTEYLSDNRYPYISAYLKDHPEIIKLYGETDSSLFGIPPYCGEQPQAIIIRRDWLDKLSLSMPSSYNDLKKVLRAFVDADLNDTNCYGLAIPDIWYDMNVITAYTGVNGFSFWTYDKDRWIYQTEMNGFIDAVKYLHDLYSEGLLESQYGISGEEDTAEMFISGKVGATFFTPSLENYNQIVNGVKENYPDAECEFIVPYMASDIGNSWIRNYGYYSVTMLSATTAPEKIDKILSIMNWSLSEEGIQICTYGLEGVHYSINADGNMCFIEPAFSRDLPSSRSYAIQIGLDESTPIALLPNEIVKLQSESVKDGILDKLVVQVPNDKIADLDIMTGLDEAIFEVYERYFQGFIIGTIDIETDWTDFLTELDIAGLEEYRSFLTKYASLIN